MNTTPTKEEMLKYWTSKVDQMTQHNLKEHSQRENIGAKTMINFHLQVGDKVTHIKDSSWTGTITHIDENLIESHGVTTCNVKWDDTEELDIQWSNKLVLV